MNKKLKTYQKEIINNLPNKIVISVPEGLGKSKYQQK